MRHSTNQDLQNVIFGSAVAMFVITIVVFGILYLSSANSLLSLAVLLLGPIDVVFLVASAITLAYLKYKEVTTKVLTFEKEAIPL